jgi:uncharacterized membrane protein YedE/YeeE
MENKRPSFGDPYAAGILLGITLLASFVILGAGLGASSGMARLGAYIEHQLFPSHTMNSAYFGSWGETPLRYYLFYMLMGTFMGGLISAFFGKRFRLGVEKGNKAPIRLRFVYALCGGLLVGFASRLAGGCTSGQALTGSALLLTGSIIFLVCLFTGGYAAAHFFRRQWDD